MSAINKEIGLDDALRGIGAHGERSASSDDEKLSGSESGKGGQIGRANEIEVVGKEL